jgi:hypothetical protein
MVDFFLYKVNSVCHVTTLVCLRLKKSSVELENVNLHVKVESWLNVSFSGGMRDAMIDHVDDTNTNLSKTTPHTMKFFLLLAVLVAEAFAFAPPLSIHRTSTPQSKIFLSAEADVPSPYDAYEPGQAVIAIKDVTLGTGEGAKEGDTVVVSIVGKVYQSGMQFAMNDDFSFELGAGKAFPGFDDGLAGAKVGGRRLLRVPPALAFGTTGSTTIPPNSDLEFECEIKEIARDSMAKMMAQVTTTQALGMAFFVALLGITPFLN